MVYKDGISNAMDKAFCIAGNASGGHQNLYPNSSFYRFKKVEFPYQKFSHTDLITKMLTCIHMYVLYVLYVSNRRHPDSNWGVKDLQSSALPLGYVAFLHFYKSVS